MTKPSPTKYSETETRARLGKMLGAARDAPYSPLKMTATLKRRALKKGAKAAPAAYLQR